MFSAAFQSFEKIGEVAGFTGYCFRQTSKIKESLDENLKMFRSFSIRRDVATKAFVGRPSYQKSSIPLDSKLFSSFEFTKEQKLGLKAVLTIIVVAVISRIRCVNQRFYL